VLGLPLHHLRFLAKSKNEIGVLGGARTHNHRFRKTVLCPVELRELLKRLPVMDHIHDECDIGNDCQDRQDDSEVTLVEFEFIHLKK
jgi:hypothetical protein